jgi:hypothetical protein
LELIGGRLPPALPKTYYLPFTSSATAAAAASQHSMRSIAPACREGIQTGVFVQQNSSRNDNPSCMHDEAHHKLLAKPRRKQNHPCPEQLSRTPLDSCSKQALREEFLSQDFHYVNQDSDSFSRQSIQAASFNAIIVLHKTTRDQRRSHSRAAAAAAAPHVINLELQENP